MKSAEDIVRDMSDKTVRRMAIALMTEFQFENSTPFDEIYDIVVLKQVGPKTPDWRE